MDRIHKDPVLAVSLQKAHARLEKKWDFRVKKKRPFFDKRKKEKLATEGEIKENDRLLEFEW